MARVTLYIAIFIVLMNLTAVAMADSGAYEDWGIGLDPGGDDVINPALGDAENVSAQSQADQQTLFGLFVSTVASILSVLTLFVAGGPIMLANLGFPSWLTGLIFGPAYIVIAADVIHLLTGRDTG